MKKLVTKLVFAASLMVSANAFAQCDDTNFDAWDDAREDVAGTLEAVAPGLAGTTCLMQTQATASDADRARVQDATPSCESSYRVRFLYDMTALGQLASAERVKTFNFQCVTAQNGGAASCPNTGIFQLKLKGDNSGTGNIFRSFVTDEGVANADNRRKFDIPVGVSAGEEALELAWTRASGAGVADGTLRVWFNGNTTEASPDIEYTDLDNFNYCVDQANLGLVKANVSFATGQTGVNMNFDEFESRRTTGIGVN